MIDYKKVLGYTRLGTAVAVTLICQPLAFAHDVTADWVDIHEFPFSATNTGNLGSSHFTYLSVADPTTGREYGGWFERYGSVQITEVFSG